MFTPAERADMAARYDSMALAMARRFRDRGELWDDLVQVARIGLLHAIDRFDPDHGSAFESFATVTMMGELRRHFRDSTWAIKVPRRAKDLQAPIRDTVRRLTLELSRSPRPEEVARALGVRLDHVLEAMDAGASYRASSLDEPVSAGSRRNAGDSLEGHDTPVDERVMLRQLMDQLPERERAILELRFGQGMSQDQIAVQVGISQMHVSRLLRATLSRLRNDLVAED